MSAAEVSSDFEALAIAFNLPILSGQSNYVRWKRIFKMIAECKDLWTVFDGTERVIPVPNPIDFDLGTLNEQESPSSAEDWPLVDRLALYKIHLKLHETHQGRLADATTLLICSIGPRYRMLISEVVTSPAESWTLLEQRCSMPDQLALNILHNRFENMSCDDFARAEAYITELYLLLQDMEDVGSSKTDDQMGRKIIGGLPDAFLDIVEEYEHLIANNEYWTLDKLCEDIRHCEVELVRRERRKSAEGSGDGGGGAGGGGAGAGGGGGRHAGGGKRKYEARCGHCGRRNHAYNECYWAHPRLRPKWIAECVLDEGDGSDAGLGVGTYNDGGGGRPRRR